MGVNTYYMIHNMISDIWYIIWPLDHI